jgi:hypothetical protein
MNHRNDRPGESHPGNPDFHESNPDQYGREQFGRKQYGPSNEPRYFGTGSQGHGGGPRESYPYPRAFGTPRARPQRRRYPMGPKGYQRSDERLREDISERLMEAYEIDSSEVTVEVLGGKVVLEGTVPDRYMKHAIEDLADAAPGVQDVDNRIRVASRAWSGTGDTGQAPRDMEQRDS